MESQRSDIKECFTSVTTRHNSEESKEVPFVVSSVVIVPVFLFFGATEFQELSVTEFRGRSGARGAPGLAARLAAAGAQSVGLVVAGIFGQRLLVAHYLRRWTAFQKSNVKQKRTEMILFFLVSTCNRRRATTRKTRSTTRPSCGADSTAATALDVSVPCPRSKSGSERKKTRYDPLKHTTAPTE